METLIAGVLFISASMGNYGTPPVPYHEDHGSYRGQEQKKVDQSAAPRSPSTPPVTTPSGPSTPPSGIGVPVKEPYHKF